jgi:hypothetical protein
MGVGVAIAEVDVPSLVRIERGRNERTGRPITFRCCRPEGRVDAGTCSACAWIQRHKNALSLRYFRNTPVAMIGKARGDTVGTGVLIQSGQEVKIEITVVYVRGTSAGARQSIIVQIAVWRPCFAFGGSTAGRRPITRSRWCRRPS